MAAQVEAHQRTIIGQERLKRELELGRQIQHDMLPRAPLSHGVLDVDGISVSAREVGGDFFHYDALPDGQIVLVIGDVSGKGVGAALLMANIHASLRTRLSVGQELAAIVDAIDRDLEANSPGQMYATLFLGILDPIEQRLRYVNAGHLPQFHVRGDGPIAKLDSTGLPIGLLAGHGYLEAQIQLTPGDLLFFYTDGCVETESETEEMFGTERLESLVSACGGRNTRSTLEYVHHALESFRGTREPFDDATLMAARIA
jgi:sigma-B regulation protein RsbU (phosphoserine phosphatase)